jgi:integrase
LQLHRTDDRAWSLAELTPKRSISVGEFLAQCWLPAIRTTIRPTTFHGYRSHVEHQIEPRLGSLQLSRLSASHLNGFYADLLTDGRANRTGGLNPTTVKRVHATIHRALRDAVRWGYLSKNPADAADPPRKAESLEMRTWTSQELRRFLNAVRTDDFYELWLLYAVTGMRRGEALGLRWCDVDLSRQQIAVRQTVIAVGGDIYVSRPKTAKGRRVIALDRTTTASLRRLERRTKPGDDHLLFSNGGNEPLDPTRVTKRFLSLVKENGLPPIRLHDLRHTHATLALQAGIHPKIVSERLGHSTVSLTLDVYSHAIPHMQKDAAAKIAGLVFGKKL